MGSVLDERHHRRDRHPVVRAERRAVGGQPLAVADKGNPAIGGIVREAGVALADHVEMPLEHERGRRLAAGGRGHPDDEVAAGVLFEVETMPLGPRANVIDHRLLVT